MKRAISADTFNVPSARVLPFIRMLPARIAGRTWKVSRMTVPDDFINRRDAITVIQAEMKRTYTAARRQGYKACIDILMKQPRAKAQPVELSPPVAHSPAPLHSFWFINAGWWFCDNCGGRSFSGVQHLYCPHCGAKMDEMDEIE